MSYSDATMTEEQYQELVAEVFNATKANIADFNDHADLTAGLTEEQIDAACMEVSLIEAKLEDDDGQGEERIIAALRRQITSPFAASETDGRVSETEGRVSETEGRVSETEGRVSETEQAELSRLASTIERAEILSAISQTIEAPATADNAPESDQQYFGFNEKEAARFSKQQELLVEQAGKLYAGSLADHVRFGKACYDHIAMCKTAMNNKRAKLGRGEAFSDSDHQSQCRKIAELAERRQAIGKDGSKKSDVRVLDDIRAYKFLEYAGSIVDPDVLAQLPWSVVNTYLAPKALSYSEKEMGGQVRLAWVEFVKEWTTAYANFGAENTKHAGETNYRGLLAQAIKDHDAAIKEEKNGGKTLEQQAAAKVAKGAQKANGLKKKAETTLVNALSNALAGVLTPQEVADIIALTTRDMGVELPVTKTVASTMDVDGIIAMLGAVATDADTDKLCKTMFSQNKADGLAHLSQYAGQLARLSKPELKVA